MVLYLRIATLPFFLKKGARVSIYSQGAKGKNSVTIEKQFSCGSTTNIHFDRKVTPAILSYYYFYSS